MAIEQGLHATHADVDAVPPMCCNMCDAYAQVDMHGDAGALEASSETTADVLCCARTHWYIANSMTEMAHIRTPTLQLRVRNNHAINANILLMQTGGPFALFPLPQANKSHICKRHTEATANVLSDRQPPQRTHKCASGQANVTSYWQT